MREEQSFHVLHGTASQHGLNIPSKGCVMVTIKGNHPFKEVNEPLSERKTHMLDFPFKDVQAIVVKSV